MDDYMEDKRHYEVRNILPLDWGQQEVAVIKTHVTFEEGIETAASNHNLSVWDTDKNEQVWP